MLGFRVLGFVAAWFWGCCVGFGLVAGVQWLSWCCFVDLVLVFVGLRVGCLLVYFIVIISCWVCVVLVYLGVRGWRVD